MVVVPAVGLGLLVAFILGAGATYMITYLTAEQIAKRKRGNPVLPRETPGGPGPDHLAKEGIERISLAVGITGGAIVVVVLIILLIVAREWSALIWWVLTAMGVLFGLSTFVFLRSESRMPTKQRPADAQTRQQSRGTTPGHWAAHQADGTPTEQRGSDRERLKHQAEYRAGLHQTQRRQERVEAIKRDLYSLFAMSDDQSRKRARKLAGVMNRFFKASDIGVPRAFALVKPEGKGLVEHIEGVAQIGGHLYLIEVNWQNEPLGAQEVSAHSVRSLSRGCTGGILISKSQFNQAAMTACEEASAQRMLILCELEEIVTLLEKGGSLGDFLGAKIAAAAADKSLLFKPLGWA
jgi:hypothetical protein